MKTRAVLKCVDKEFGELSVVTILIVSMLVWCAGSFNLKALVRFNKLLAMKFEVKGFKIKIVKVVLLIW